MRLKELRTDRGISQLKLAMDLNMNQNSISRYDSIYTSINLRYYDFDEEAPVDANIIGGKLKNPFKK